MPQRRSDSWVHRVSDINITRHTGICANCGPVDVKPRKERVRRKDGTTYQSVSYMCGIAVAQRMKRYAQSSKGKANIARRRAIYALKKRRAYYQALNASIVILERTDTRGVDPAVAKQFGQVVSHLRKEAARVKRRHLDPADGVTHD